MLEWTIALYAVFWRLRTIRDMNANNSINYSMGFINFSILTKISRIVEWLSTFYQFEICKVIIYFFCRCR